MSKFKSEGDGVLSTVRKDGKTVYFIRYGWKGRRLVERVGLNESRARGRIEARREAMEDPSYIPPPVKREMAAAARAEAAAKAAPMFADLLKVYQPMCASLHRRQDWQKAMIEIVAAEFADLTVEEVTPERVEAWRDRLQAKGKSVRTVRKYVYFVSGIFRNCMKDAKGRNLVTDNPVSHILLPSEPTGLKKSLTLKQAVALTMAARCDPTLERWAWLVIYTGMRVQEAMRLCWGDVRLDDREFDIHETKTGQPRVVALGDKLIPKVTAWHEGDDPHADELVIGEEFKTVPTQRWRRVFADAGIPWGLARGKFTTRNLRTTFCMLAFQNGARPEELVQQTGHSLTTLFGYYAQASPEQRERAVNRMPEVAGRHLEAV